MDVNMFEGANFPWRRPGADIADWFNYGFDEVSWRTFLGYRNEMERGREQMVSAAFGFVWFSLVVRVRRVQVVSPGTVQLHGLSRGP